MRFADAGYAVLRDDVTAQISERQFNGYLEEKGIRVGTTSEFPYQVEVEFGDNVIVETTVLEESVARYVMFGDISYNANGSMAAFSMLREYVMNYDEYDEWQDGSFWGGIYDFGSGTKDLFHFDPEFSKEFKPYSNENTIYEFDQSEGSES